MTAKHSPGPWKDISESPSKTWIGNSYVIAEVIRFPEQQEESKANARLIASAPDLLAALEAMINAKEKQSAYYKGLEEGQEPNSDTIGHAIIDEVLATEKARAAIAKAKGGT